MLVMLTMPAVNLNLDLDVLNYIDTNKKEKSASELVNKALREQWKLNK